MKFRVLRCFPHHAVLSALELLFCPPSPRMNTVRRLPSEGLGLTCPQFLSFSPLLVPLLEGKEAVVLFKGSVMLVPRSDFAAALR